MVIKLLSAQIVPMWEAIKFAATQADEVDQQELQPYLNELLHALLSDKAQCFVRINEDNREILAVLITRILTNKIATERYLQIQTVYGFKYGDEETWKKDFNVLQKFAEQANCLYMGFVSRNKRIWQIGEMLGFKEMHRTFAIRLES